MLLVNYLQALEGLAEENAGSRWPKITLAALRPGQQLSLEDLELLRALCLREKDRLAQEVGQISWAPTELSVVAYTYEDLFYVCLEGNNDVMREVLAPGNILCVCQTDRVQA